MLKPTVIVFTDNMCGAFHGQGRSWWTICLLVMLCFLTQNL